MRTKAFAAAALVMLMSGVALAAGENPAAPQAVENHKYLWGFAMGLGLAFAAGMAAFSQSRAIAASVESVARQPEAGGRLQTMMLIGVVFIETLVIFTWVLFFLWGTELFKAAGAH
jgi:F-type H+-transporting ATPase subunit c